MGICQRKGTTHAQRDICTEGKVLSYVWSGYSLSAKTTLRLFFMVEKSRRCVCRLLTSVVNLGFHQDNQHMTIASQTSAQVRTRDFSTAGLSLTVNPCLFKSLCYLLRCLPSFQILLHPFVQLWALSLKSDFSSQPGQWNDSKGVKLHTLYGGIINTALLGRNIRQQFRFST